MGFSGIFYVFLSPCCCVRISSSLSYTLVRHNSYFYFISFLLDIMCSFGIGEERKSDYDIIMKLCIGKSENEITTAERLRLQHNYNEFSSCSSKSQFHNKYNIFAYLQNSILFFYELNELRDNFFPLFT
jgi:hypothetical protein